MTVRTALDRAAERIAGKFDKQLEVQAAIRTTIGRSYIGLGLYTLLVGTAAFAQLLVIRIYV